MLSRDIAAFAILMVLASSSAGCSIIDGSWPAGATGPRSALSPPLTIYQ